MYELLSHPLEDGSPVHQALDDVRISIRNRIPVDGYETHTIITSNHAGTHVDAPAHFIEGGKRICEYSIDELVFNDVCTVDVDVGPGDPIGSGDIEIPDCDLLLIRTGFESVRGEDTYLHDNPWLTPELIDKIRRNFRGIRAIGVDCISISNPEHPSEGEMAHLRAFTEAPEYGEPVLILEDMKLTNAPEVIERVFVVPWTIEGVDSAPCTVIAEFKV